MNITFSNIRSEKQQLANILVRIIIIVCCISMLVMYSFLTHDYITIVGYGLVLFFILYYIVLGWTNCYKVQVFKHHIGLRICLLIFCLVFVAFDLIISIKENFAFDGEFIPLPIEVTLMLVPIQCVINGFRADKT